MPRKITTQPPQEEKLAASLVPKEEQPYNVPQNWCWARLGSVSKIIMGQSPKGTEVTNDSSCLPLIGGASDIGELYPIISRYTKVANKLSEVGDIIICIRATLGRPVFADKIYCLGRGVAAVRANIISKKYIRYCLIGLEQYFYDNAAGTTFLQITSTTLNEMPFPIPPLAEQNRIVRRIENFFAKLTAAKAKLIAALESFAERKAAILHRAFTGELTAKWREENGVSVESWEEKTLQDIANNHDNQRIPLSQEDRANLKKIYDYYGASGVIDKVEEYIFDGKYLLIGEDGANLVTRSKPIAFIAQGKFWVNNHAHILTSNSISNIDFICYYINSIDLHPYITGSAQPKMTQAKMNKIPVKIPTLPEQKEIVRILDEIFANEAVAKAAVESAINTIDTAKKSILARAFRGQLGTNDPADENACDLLRRII